MQKKKWEKPLKDFSPDIVAISCLTFYEHSLNFLVVWIKENLKCIIVVGGPHASSHGESLLLNENIDYVCIGEGEYVFNQLLNTIRNNTNIFDNIPGLCYRKNNTIRLNEPELITEIGKLKYPTLNQINPIEYANYSSQLILKLPYVPILTSRGCNYKCVYCHNIFGKRVRYRPIQSVIEEINYWINNTNIDTFYIIDDIFNVNKKRLIELFDYFKGKNIKFAFPNGLRGDILDSEVINRMIDGGTFFVVVAIESGSPRIQKLIRKNINLDKLSNNIGLLGDSGVLLGAFNMIGFPTENEIEVEETIQFNVSHKEINKSTFFILNPFPNTEVYNMALKEGYIPSNDYSKGYFQPSLSSPTKNISNLRLVELQKKAYSRFYLDTERLYKTLNYSFKNIPKEKYIEFLQVDYSYVLSMILKYDSILETKDLDIFPYLETLFPNDLLVSY